ncbi:recombinase family protein [Shigella sonnei]|nr:recombinase family protein [Shigella sonnei]EFV2640613.1 recombinase family protein [Shigella sonnei]
MTGRLLLGYARVSTDDQDLTHQRAELHAAGCTRIYAEKITGTRRDRPELARLLDHLRPGDVVTVTRLDRLARSTRDLLDIAERIQASGAGLRSLAEPWADTTTPAGRMVLTVFAGIAEFERTLIIDRTRSGREAAKRRGVKFGPRPTLTPAQIAHARDLIEQEGRQVKEVAELFGVHRSTLYRALERSEEVTAAEAKQRGAFEEDALTEVDALAAGGDQVDERQEEMPFFDNESGPSDDLPPPPYRTQSRPQILAALADDELASWPGDFADEERARRSLK